ncbi:hypothetical protein [Microbacterium sp.]|uniref:hypothetical protein n=1 Tax=Microbacterium sp. TaxID=51671 RepID=UPI002811276A|nr:hypothetical protein [Microbacterium sp.]
MSSIRDPRGDEPAGVSVILALVIGVTSFVSLTILGLGMLSYFADVDIISVPELSMWPGIVGMVAATLVFAVITRSVLSRPHPSFRSAATIGFCSALTHLAGVWLGALLGGVGLVHAAAAVSQLIVRGSSLVVLTAAAVGAWAAIALRRTRASAPHWPWERADEE